MSRADGAYDVLMHPLESLAFRRLRRALVPLARGRVLEIGAGTGANLPYYRWEAVRELHLVDLEVTERVAAFAARRGAAVRAREADIEALPFADATFDAVVATLVFCSVPDAARGLAEVRRVLKPDGRLIFVEHVRPRRPAFARLVDAVAPLWHTVMGPCHLDRDTLAAMVPAGFAVERCEGSGMIICGTAAPAAVPWTDRRGRPYTGAP